MEPTQAVANTLCSDLPQSHPGKTDPTADSLGIGYNRKLLLGEWVSGSGRSAE